MNGRHGNRYILSFQKSRSNVLTLSFILGLLRKKIRERTRMLEKRKCRWEKEEEAQGKAVPSSSMSTCEGFHFEPIHLPFPLSGMEATFIFLLSHPSLLELVCPQNMKDLDSVLPSICCIIDHFDLHLAACH